MLGQPVSMLIPRVVGFKLTGELPTGTTATDLVLTITEMLRKHGVVGKFVEFYGEGVGATSLANRATIGNMSPEFGSTAAIFPIDAETLKYLRLTGRDAQQVALVEAYAKTQGLWLDPAAEPDFSEKLELDLSTVVPSISRPQAPAGPYRPGQLLPAVRPRRAQLRHRRRGGGQGVLPGLRLPGRGRRRADQADPGAGPRRLDVRDRPRRRHGRRDHLLHQHLEPLRHDRGRARGQEGRREGSDQQAVGEDHARPGLEGRHRLLRQGAADPVSGQARLQPGRLRLHHLHRQLGPAARRGLQGGQRGRPRGGRGALRQPQLRGPDQPGRQDELPGVPAAGRRLRHHAAR